MGQVQLGSEKKQMVMPMIAISTPKAPPTSDSGRRLGMDHSAIIRTSGIGGSGTRENYISASAISPFKHHFMSTSLEF